MSLTDHDRKIIAEARELAAPRDSDALRASLEAAGTLKGGEPDEMVYPAAFGHARWLLGELAVIAGRLDAAGR